MKGHAKRWLSMLVVLCMIFTLAVPMYAAAQTEDITILYTNDIHTYINNGQVGDGDQAHDSWSYSRLASYKESLGENKEPCRRAWLPQSFGDKTAVCGKTI